MAVELTDKQYGIMARALAKIARDKRVSTGDYRARLTRREMLEIARIACVAVGIDWATAFLDESEGA